MKKILLLLCLCGISMKGFTQNVIDKLQGTWLCDSITDDFGKPTKGGYREAGKYLEFRFTRKRVEVIKSPFATSGVFENITLLDTNYIVLLPPRFTINVEKGTKRVGNQYGYEVIDRGDSAMVLRTENNYGNYIRYVLKRPQDIRKKSASDTVDIGYALVRRVKDIVSGKIRILAKTDPASTLNYYYGIPRFHYGESSFEGFFGENIEIADPTDFKKNEPDEYIVEFDVTKDGVGNIMVTGLNSNMKDQLSKAIIKSSKRWKFEEDIPADYKARLKFHFFFFLG